MTFMLIITIMAVLHGIQACITDSDGTVIIHGMILGIMAGDIRAITAVGTVLGITADGILRGITVDGIARGITAAGIHHGIMEDFMILGIMVMVAGMVAVITGDTITDIMLHYLLTDQEEVQVHTEQVQQIV